LISHLSNKRRELTTTLLRLLFGVEGIEEITFEQLKMLCHNLQREIIEIEFSEFSLGTDHISAADFAHFILRYSSLSESDRRDYIQRIRELGGNSLKISYESFEQFALFLNNLDEFTKAVKLHIFAGIPVTQSEFIRAAKCSSGIILDASLVEVIFMIFDVNGDDRLNCSEFIEIVRSPLHRVPHKSIFTKIPQVGWRSFKNCILNELATKN